MKIEEGGCARKAEADIIRAREREEEAEQQSRFDRLAPLHESHEHQQLEVNVSASVTNVAE